MTLKKKITEIRNLIKNSKNPIMFFDTDADGTTSYFQLKKAFPKIKGFYMKKENQDSILEIIKEKNDLIIFFDIPYLKEEFLEKIKNKKIIWADHHLTNDKKLIKEFKIIHLNPLNYDLNDNRPSSFLAYNVSNLKENLPYAVLGSLSDYFLLDLILELNNYNEKIFNQLFKITNEKKNELLEFIRKYKFNNKNQIKKRNFWIKYLTYECGFIDFKNLFDLMYKLDEKKNPKIILDSIKSLENQSILEIKGNLSSGKGKLFENLNNMKKKYDKIFKKILNNQIDEKFIFIEYSGKTSFTRQIAEKLAYKFPNFELIIVIFKKKDKDYYSASFRSQKIDVNELIKKSLKNLDGKGGGHKFASGCSINKKDFEKFKQIIEKNINL